MKITVGSTDIANLSALDLKLLQNDLVDVADYFRQAMNYAWQYPFQLYVNANIDSWKAQLLARGVQKYPQNIQQFAAIFVDATADPAVPISIDGVSFMTIPAIAMAVLRLSNLDLPTLVLALVNGKRAGAIRRLRNVWEPILVRDLTTVPITDADFTAAVFARSDYKNRVARVAADLAAINVVVSV